MAWFMNIDLDHTGKHLSCFCHSPSWCMAQVISLHRTLEVAQWLNMCLACMGLWDKSLEPKITIIGPTAIDPIIGPLLQKPDLVPAPHVKKRVYPALNEEGSL